MGGMEECTEGRREGGKRGWAPASVRGKKNISGVSQLEAG